MTKKELIDKYIERQYEHGIVKKKNKATEEIEDILNLIIDAVESGEGVDISRFGKTEYKKKEARTAFNPATGGTVDVPAKTVCKFKFVKPIRDKVAEL